MATSMVAWGKAICAAAVDPVPVIGRASAFRHYGRRRGRDAAGPGHAVHVRLLRRGVHVLPPRRRRPRDGYLIVGQQSRIAAWPKMSEKKTERQSRISKKTE
ncbi:hypothetical protein EJB05_26702, partial [Eragrostis curvula]